MDGHHNSWDTGMLDHGEVSLSEQGTSGSIFCHGSYTMHVANWKF